MTVRRDQMPARVLAIVHSVAIETGVSVARIMGKRRDRKFVRARWEAMRRTSEAPMPSARLPSLAQVGRWFGLDHTSVLAARAKGWTL